MLTCETEQNRARGHLVRDARAGLIPESDAVADEIRARMKIAARTLLSLAANAERPSRTSENRAIMEILADLRHYCEFKGYAYDELDTAATELYESEGNLTLGYRPGRLLLTLISSLTRARFSTRPSLLAR